jgi:hypothetical protein
MVQAGAIPFYIGVGLSSDSSTRVQHSIVSVGICDK